MIRQKRTTEERQQIQIDKANARQIRAEILAQNKRIRLDKRNEQRLNERANTYADKIIADIKEKLTQTNELTQQINLNKRIKGTNRNTYLKTIINKVNNLDVDKQKYITQEGNLKDYALNKNNKQVIKDFIEGTPRTNNYGKESDEEIEELIEDTLKDNKPIIIKFKPFIHQYEKKRGAFFPYYNISSLDLTEYQITKGNATYYKDNHAHNILAENCLIYAMRMQNMEEGKLSRLKSYVVGQKVILNDLKQIAEDLNIKIILHQLRKGDLKIGNTKGLKQTKTTYGTNETEIYNIALHSGHYFKYEKSNFTAYFINNYNELKHHKNANFIYKIKGNSICRDATRTINSLDLIELLITNKEAFLIEITKQIINDYDKQFNPIKLKTDFTNFDLSYNEKDKLTNQCKLRQYARKEMKISYKYILYADFETITDANNLLNADMLNGVLYDRDNNLIKTISKNLTHSPDFIRAFLYDAILDNTIIYFHNAKFDYNYLIREIKGTSEIMNGGNFISHKGTFKKHHIIIKDSYKIISSPLANFPELFKNIQGEKEFINHNFYNMNDIYKNNLFTKDDFLEQFKPNGKYPQSDKYDDDTAEIVLNNCERLGFINEDGLIDALKYRSYYCDMDCRILAEGMITIRKQYLEEFNIDIYDILTTPAIANTHLALSGVFEYCVELTGHLREYIEGSIVGGRVMTANNEKIHIKGKLADMDAVSLYPSAMVRLEGLPEGEPKILTEEQLDYNTIKGFDWYIVDVEITDLKIKRAFPLLSIKNDKGTRIFTNEIIGEVFRVDKIQLEDLIEFQGVSFKIIKGLYFDEGFNPDIKEVVSKLFSTRKKLKAKGDEKENIYKLILNSAYGKMIQKEHDEKTKIISGKKNIETYVSRNYNEIKHITYYDTREKREKARIAVSSGRKAHFNLPHLGGMILSMSKRIMNEVICLAEDNKIDIYYQDTDSIHLKFEDINNLKKLYANKYNRVLEGKSLGQFHTDLKMEFKHQILYINRDIINDVIEIAKLNDINLFLIGEDFIHLKSTDITNLKTLYFNKYNIKLEASITNLNEDDLKTLSDNVYSTELIAIDKKTYLHKLEGVLRDVKYDGGYMVRCKGISRKAIDHFTNKNNIDVREFFKKLYNGEELICDLCGGGEVLKINIDTKRNIITKKDEFLRTLHFPKKPINGKIKN